MANNTRIVVGSTPAQAQTQLISTDAPKEAGYLELKVELANGELVDLNYFFGREGKFMSTDIKLFEDIPLHAWLLKAFATDPSKAENLPNKLVMKFKPRVEKVQKQVDDFAVEL